LIAIIAYMNQDQRTYLLKKILYKSNYRGCRETDQVLGSFVKKHIDEFSDSELAALSKLLEEMDVDIWDWINHKKPIPRHIPKDLIEKIISHFRP